MPRKLEFVKPKKESIRIKLNKASAPPPISTNHGRKASINCSSSVGGGWGESAELLFLFELALVDFFLAKRRSYFLTERPNNQHTAALWQQNETFVSILDGNRALLQAQLIQSLHFTAESEHTLNQYLALAPSIV